VDLTEDGPVSYSLPVINSSDGTTEVTLKSRENLSVILTADSGKPTLTIEAPRFTFAPVEKDAVLGYAVFRIGSSEIGRLPLYAENECKAPKKPSLFERLLGLYK